MKIALDAGHGKNTAGRRIPSDFDAKQTREWQLNSRIVEYAANLLVSAGYEVVRTDDPTGVVDVSLSDRCLKANTQKCDYFISIHHNAGVNKQTGGGTSCYYYKDNTYAAALYKNIVAQTQLFGNRVVPVQKANFYVLRHTTMPAILVENGFMDSATDAPIILSSFHANKTAEGILNFVRELSCHLHGSDSSDNYFTPCDASETSIVDALISIGIDYSLSYRKEIGRYNHIDKIGLAEGNTLMLELLKKGQLKIPR